MRSVLHLIHFDNYFLDVVIRIFERNNILKNTFLVETKIRPNTNKNNNVIYKSQKEILRGNYLNSLGKYDIIIIHKLSKFWAKVIDKISINSIIVWSAWGAEFYQIHPNLKKFIFQEKTKEIQKTLTNIKAQRLKPIIDSIFPFRTTYHLQKKIIKKISYIAPVIYDDYEIIKKQYHAEHLKHLEFSYGTLEEDFIFGIKPNVKLGCNILLGNSSWYSNNHIEVIDLLEGVNLEKMKVITPLSYGDERLRNYLINYGAKKINGNFIPLTKYLDREKYYSRILSCGFLIINSNRQQALGNIITMLYLGAKVFLNPVNPTYEYFNRLNANVFLIDEIKEKKEKAFIPLNEKQIMNNREIMIKTRGRSHVDELINKIAQL